MRSLCAFSSFCTLDTTYIPYPNDMLLLCFWFPDSSGSRAGDLAQGLCLGAERPGAVRYWKSLVAGRPPTSEALARRRARVLRRGRRRPLAGCSHGPALQPPARAHVLRLGLPRQRAVRGRKRRVSRPPAARGHYTPARESDASIRSSSLFPLFIALFRDLPAAFLLSPTL